MPLLRRKPSSPPPLLVTDMAMGDAEVARVRDLAVQRQHWAPAADLLSATASSPDRRGVLVGTLGEAAVQPAPWLDAWCAARPDDPGLHCVLVSTAVARAWDARGGGWASQTGEDQFAAFHRLLADALALFHRAVRSGGDDPTPWVLSLALCIGRGEPREVFDDRWAELTARHAHSRQGHNSALTYLCEKWNGSHEQMYAFARSVTEPPWAPVLVLQAHAEFLLKEGDTDRKAFWSRQDVAADLGRAYAWAVSGPHSYPHALHDLTVVAHAHARAERWPQAAELFALTGSQAYEYPWYYDGEPAREFAAAHRQALARARR